MKKESYYGLFLTKKSRELLKEWLLTHTEFHSRLIQCDRKYLDHCTLLYSKGDVDSDLEVTLSLAISMGVDFVRIIVDGIGISDKAMAFRVILPFKEGCENEIPHITICTFNGGNPVDSNDITEWKDIDYIVIETQLAHK